MKEKLDFIKSNYKNMTKEEMAHKLNMTRNQIEWLMKKNHIKLYTSKKYSDYELNFIKENYPKHGSKYCAIQLGRSENAINKKIKKMGLSINWKYEYINYEGYLVNCKDRNNKYMVHRKVMEEKIGRRLRSDEIVHHIDGNKLNNDPNNLELTNRSDHMKIHKDDINKCRYKI